MVMWGYSPSETKKQKQQQALAAKSQEDPLYNFPYDVNYLTKEQVEEKLKVSRRFKKLPKLVVWDRDRADACLGKQGLVARRCSMNDKLWGILKEAREKGVVLNLADVKKFIMIDVKRSQLYPSGWKDDSMPPPPEFIEKLRTEGKLDKILREISEVTRGNA